MKDEKELFGKLNCEDFSTNSNKLEYVMGKDKNGNLIFNDLKKQGRLLVTGANQEDKNEFILTMLSSMIVNASPENVRLFLINNSDLPDFDFLLDVKHLYNKDINCLSTNMCEHLDVLDQEMRRRDIMLSSKGIDNIDEYNQSKDCYEKLPFIVVVLNHYDEYILSKKWGFELKLKRFFKRAEKIGIYFVLVPEKSIKEVLTGFIKANISNRVCFAEDDTVSSMVAGDRCILSKIDKNGKFVCFSEDVDDGEEYSLVNMTAKEGKICLKRARDFWEEFEAENLSSKQAKKIFVADLEKIDPLLPYALKEVIKSKNASGTLLRKKFAIGFSRSMKLIDLMEDLGFISANIPMKPRKVFLTVSGFEQIMNKKISDLKEPPEESINYGSSGILNHYFESFASMRKKFGEFAEDYGGRFTKEEIEKLVQTISKMKPKEEE